MAMLNGDSYHITKLPTTGAIVEGLDLAAPIVDEVIDRIKSDLRTHSLLIFKNQGRFSPEKQVEVSRWFGDLFVLPKPNENALVPADVSSTPHSPHPSIFCVSNDARFGSTGVGVAGWHNDGLVFQKPFANSIYHMVSVPTDDAGSTQFSDLSRVTASLTPAEKWELDGVFLRDLGTGVVHPLLYEHPATGKQVLCLGLGSWAGLGNHVKAYSRDLAGNDRLSQEESDALEEKLISLLDKNMYEHVWGEGQVLISDNLAVAHKASPNTQRPPSDVGLRLLHRTSVLGTFEPLVLKATQTGLERLHSCKPKDI